MTLEKIDKQIAYLKSIRHQFIVRTPRKYIVRIKGVEKFENGVEYDYQSCFCTNSLDCDAITRRFNSPRFIKITIKVYDRKNHKLVKELEK